MGGTYRLQKSYPTSPRIASVRKLHQTKALAYPRKDSQHKDSINTEATEYSKSGTDDQAAREEDAAFDPKKTSPEEEHETAGTNSAVSQEPPRVHDLFTSFCNGGTVLNLLLTIPPTFVVRWQSPRSVARESRGLQA